VALPYAIGNTLFAGTVEYVALRFKAAGVESYFYYYIVAVVGMAVIAYILLPETKLTSLIDED
jgi:MHS family alpha-ketoglutarate permease-like MFS transporter